jgi:hypothetical protein
VLVIALFAGLVRLLPWMLASELPWGVVWPFAQALGAVALETSLLVGVPAGAAWPNRDEGQFISEAV